MEICSNAFITIAMILLTNKYRKKTAYCGWRYWWCCDIRSIRVRILQKLDVPWHWYSKTEKPWHQDSKIKKPLKKTLSFCRILTIIPPGIAICISTSKISSQIGAFIWWYVDCSARGLHKARLKRKSNIKKKNVLFLRK